MTTQTLGPVRAQDDLDEEVMRLFDMVTTGLAAATAAFLSGDRVAARALVADDQLIDSLHSAIEDRVQRELTGSTQHSEQAARRLISMLQIVPEIERSGDLVEHIALRTPQGLARSISPRARGMVQEMGRIGVAMWQAAATAYCNHDPEALPRLRSLDDELDDLHVSLSAELAESANSIPVAIEMGLVARFYERIGDHAVNITRRVRRMVS